MTDGWESRCWFFRPLFPFMGGSGGGSRPETKSDFEGPVLWVSRCGIRQIFCAKNTPKNASLSYSKIYSAIGKYLIYFKFKGMFCRFLPPYPEAHWPPKEMRSDQVSIWELGGGNLNHPPGNTTEEKQKPTFRSHPPFASKQMMRPRFLSVSFLLGRIREWEIASW